MSLDTLAVLVALTVGIAGLATTVTASARRTRIELRAEFKTEISRLDGRVSGLDDRVVILGDRVSRVDERVARLDERVVRLDDRFAAFDDRFSRLDDRLARLDDRVYALAAGLAPRLAPASGEAPRDE